MILRLALVLWMAIPFLYFMTAGANIFTVPKLRDNGAVLGQLSFVSGMSCVIFMGLFRGLLLPPGAGRFRFGIVLSAAL